LTKLGIERLGLASNFLKNLQEGEKVWVFLQKSPFPVF